MYNSDLVINTIIAPKYLFLGSEAPEKYAITPNFIDPVSGHLISNLSSINYFKKLCILHMLLATVRYLYFILNVYKYYA